MLRQNLIQPLSLHTILKREALRNFDNLIFSLSLEMVCPFVHEEFRDEDEARELCDAVLEGPDGPGVYSAVFFLNVFGDPVC